MRRKQNATVVLVMNLVCNYISLKKTIWNRTNNVSSNLATLFQKLINLFLQIESPLPRLTKQLWKTRDAFRTKSNTYDDKSHWVKNVRIQSYSGLSPVWIWENTNQNNSEYRNVSRSLRVKIDNGFYPLTVLTKHFIIDFLQNSFFTEDLPVFVKTSWR